MDRVFFQNVGIARPIVSALDYFVYSLIYHHGLLLTLLQCSKRVAIIFKEIITKRNKFIYKSELMRITMRNFCFILFLSYIR